MLCCLSSGVGHQVKRAFRMTEPGALTLFPSTDDEEASVKSLHSDHLEDSRESADVFHALMDAIIADAYRVAVDLPSHALSAQLSPDSQKVFQVNIETKSLWENTMGLCMQAGDWGHSRCDDVLKCSGGRKLEDLRVQIARQANSKMLALNVPEHWPCSSSGPAVSSESWRPDNLSTRVGGIYHNTIPVQPSLLSSGRASHDGGTFIGACSLHQQGSRAGLDLVGTCLVRVYAHGGEQNNVLPTHIIGRSGRVDSCMKASQLVQLVSLAIDQLSVQSEDSIEQQSLPGTEQLRRVRFCSLLNAIALDHKELSFFRSQLSELTGSLTSSVQGFVSRFFRPRSHDARELSDFSSAMRELGVDFAYLNFVANWPLSARQGCALPCGHHNTQHEHALRRHLVWVAQDIDAALDALPCEMLTRHAKGVGEHRRQLHDLCKGCGACFDHPWDAGLLCVRQAITFMAEVLHEGAGVHQHKRVCAAS